MGETYYPLVNKAELEAIIKSIEAALNVTYNGSLVEQYDEFFRTDNNKVPSDLIHYECAKFLLK